jgi:YVTN family beta-propeller protein
MVFGRILSGMAVCMMAGVCLAQGGKLLVVEKGAQSLGIVTPATGAVVSVLEEKLAGKDTGHEVAASRDGKWAYVPIYGDSGVGKPGTDGREMVVIDIATDTVGKRVDFGHPVRPHLPVLGPPVAGHPDGLLYVTTELDKAVTILDPKTLAILGEVPTGSAESHMLAVAHDGKRGYTANVGPGTVSVLDLVNRKLVTVIPVSSQVQRISISVDDKRVFTSDQTKPELDVIDTATNTVMKRVAMPGNGYGSAATPDGRWLLVDLDEANKVSVIDLKTLEVVRTLDVAGAPQAVVVRPDGKFAYVSCAASGSVAELGLTGEPATWKVTRTLPVGKGADGLAWAR